MCSAYRLHLTAEQCEHLIVPWQDSSISPHFKKESPKQNFCFLLIWSDLLFHHIMSSAERSLQKLQPHLERKCTQHTDKSATTSGTAATLLKCRSAILSWLLCFQEATVETKCASPCKCGRVSGGFITDVFINQNFSSSEEEGASLHFLKLNLNGGEASAFTSELKPWSPFIGRGGCPEDVGSTLCCSGRLPCLFSGWFNGCFCWLLSECMGRGSETSFYLHQHNWQELFN